jgi:hypothetical protein
MGFQNYQEQCVFLKTNFRIGYDMRLEISRSL